MGDVGSAFLGFTFAALAVIGAQVDVGRLSFYVVPLLLFHFIFDTFFTFIRRLINSEPVHLAHRTHLYQLLNRTGFSHTAVSLYYWALTVVQGVAAFILVNLEPGKRIYVFAPFVVCYAFCSWWVLRRARVHGLLTPV
jgi:UDP-GlcNAc:undecaprenyl-phosphate GlcNAc-1-phosphate transferase